MMLPGAADPTPEPLLQPWSPVSPGWARQMNRPGPFGMRRRGGTGWGGAVGGNETYVHVH